MDMEVYIFVAVTGFVASFIDAAAGGGGMISLPALLLTGISPLHALGTNKMAAVMGACTSFITFIRSGKMDVQLIKKLFPLSLIGSALGVLAVQQVPSEFLRPLIVVLLVAVVLYSLLKKDWDRDTQPRKLTGRMLALSMLVALVMGFYDGFFGPGTGSFLLFAFLMLGFDFIGATANTKALNFASNLAATVFFAASGMIDYQMGIFMGISMIFGAYCGARFAITKGVAYVRPMFIVVTTMLIGKQLMDLL